jgi:hypothetical protein
MLWFWQKCLESNESKFFDTHDFLMENELQLDENIQAKITTPERALHSVQGIPYSSIR